jgi:hypothetical protein
MGIAQSSLPETACCDEFLGPGSIGLNKRGKRWLGIVEPQIETGALVQRMQDAIQDDLRLVITGQQRQCKGRDGLAQRKSNKQGTRALYASAHEDPVITLHLRPNHRHWVSSPQEIQLNEVGPTAKDVPTLPLIIFPPLFVQLVDRGEQLQDGDQFSRLDLVNFEEILRDLILHGDIDLQHGDGRRSRSRGQY